MSVEILVVEDEKPARYLCEEILFKAGYQVVSVGTIEKAAVKLENHKFGLILLDLNLPDGDGIEFVKTLSGSIPVLIMSARGSATERAAGFLSGASDYLVKPFLQTELLFRVRNLVGDGDAVNDTGSCRFGDWRLYYSRRELIGERGNVHLTPGEFRLLRALARNRGRTLSRDALMRTVARNEGEGHPRTVDVLVSRLRKKIEIDPKHPAYLCTVTDIGYRLAEVVEEQAESSAVAGEREIA